MSTITLSHDQQKAWDKFNNFLMDPKEEVFVLSGYSGTGKTTLIKELVKQVPAVAKTMRLINPKQKFDYQMALTATTNKAAQALSDITGEYVTTIQSFLGLRVNTDHKKGTSSLIPNRGGIYIHNTVLFVDEISFADAALINYIFKFTNDCKIVFIGDPAQLIKVNTYNAPAFHSNFTEAHLSEVVRQVAGNPIVDLSTKFREVVETGEFFSFYPDGYYIKHLERNDFDKAIEQEFTRPDWKYKESKVLAWTNKTVVAYNKNIRNLTKGTCNFQPGDYAICNHYFKFGKKSFKTDQIVQIKNISPKIYRHGLAGHLYTFENDESAFMPDNIEEKNRLIRKSRKNEEYQVTQDACENWIDIRAAYACTVNKSQGSTFDQVFIDLDDIKHCNNTDQIARMLYVAVSRARYHVTFTGDLV